MMLDKAVIPHYIAEVIPFESLRDMVDINSGYLMEKNTWYKIEGNLEYFKVRNDLRLFSELFFQLFAKNTLSLDTLQYRIAIIRKKQGEKVEKSSTLGLLSRSFHQSDYNYFLVSELFDSTISDLKQYGDFSLKNLLLFLKDLIANDNYKKIENFLVRLFIADAFTMQLDRNENNIGFEIPIINGLSHTKRLRESIISNYVKESSQLLEPCDEFGKQKIIGLQPSKVYDNERILGIDHKNIFVNKPGDIWTPVFAYSSDLYFGSNLKSAKEKAQLVSEKSYNGMDPNLVELYLEHYTLCKDYIYRLANDDEYKKILELFSQNNSPIGLTGRQKELIENILESRRKEFKKILSLG